MLPKDILDIEMALEQTGEDSADLADSGACKPGIIEEKQQFGHHLHLMSNFCIPVSFPAADKKGC